MTEHGYDVFLYVFAVLMMALLFGSGMYVGYVLNEKRHYENRLPYATYGDADGNEYFPINGVKRQTNGRTE